MEISGLKRIVALAAVCALLFPGAARAEAISEQTGILSLLSQIPASSFASGFLSFVDVSALLAGTTDALMPESIEEFERLSGSPAGDAVLRAYMGVSAGPSNVYQNLPQSREMLSSSGIDFFTIRHMLEIGSPPLRQTWLGGGFDKADIRDKLQARGYHAMPDTRPGWEVWSKGGDIGSGQTMNLAQRDIHFPFGGFLGQSWPVMLGGDVIGATPDENAVLATAFGDEPSLAAQGPVAGMVRAASMMTGENERGALAQLYLFTPSAAGTDLLPASDGSLVPAPAANDLPAYTLLSLSQVFSADAQWVLVGLSFPDAAGAAAAIPVLRERLSQAKLDQTGGLLSEQIGKLGGQAEPLFTVPGESGSHALLIPFRFPTAGETSENGANPFWFFVRLLFARDFGWLSIGNGAQ